MRSSLLALAACAYTNLDEPIGVVSRDLTDTDAANLAEGAECWNLQFGTHYVTGDAARAVPQQVDGFYDLQTCLDAPAQTQIGYPSSIAVCPERYWSGLATPLEFERITPFRVLSHELGHELNIVGHPLDPLAVMNGGGADFGDMFARADFVVFGVANPDFVQTPACDHVVRSVRPFAHNAINHCACDVGPLDAHAPITLVLPPGATGDATAKAATCWDLRYGLQLRVGDDDGGQAMFLDPDCRSFSPIRDRNHELVCAASPTTVGTGLRAIGTGLGIDLFDALFGEEEDAQVMTHLGLRVLCHHLVQDASGACTCRDPLGV